MHIIHDLMVHRPAELWMRVEQNGDGCVAFFLWMVAAFEAAFGSGKYNLGHERPCFGLKDVAD